MQLQYMIYCLVFKGTELSLRSKTTFKKMTWADRVNGFAGPRVIFAAVSILPVDGTLLGHPSKSEHCPQPYCQCSLITSSVTVVDASVGHNVTTLPAENVYELGFSPRGTFIITWQRPSKDDNGEATKNLKVWRVVEEGALDAGVIEHNVVGRFVQKSQTGWNLQYTFDEQYCARVVTNEVQFYECGDLSTVWNKLRIDGVSDFAISPGHNHSIAVFVPERKVRVNFNTPLETIIIWVKGSTSHSQSI